MGSGEGIGCYRFISVIGQVGILVPCSRSPIGLACFPFFRRSGTRFSMPLLRRVAMRSNPF